MPGRGCVAWMGRTLTAGLLAASFAVPSLAQPLDAGATERRQRWSAARAGALKLPLPGTPDTMRPLSRLFSAGLALGAPVMIRIFKAEAILEVWMKRGHRFEPFASYPVCYFSGLLGPKKREGDRQAPEGFYAISEDLLHHGGRWRRSLNLGYPNAFDRIHGRTGSALLIHGGCDSSGCFAMTDAVSAELYDLVSAALRGASHVPAHVFPFRMTDAAMASLPESALSSFWRDLKLGYDSFERTGLPPHVTVCGLRYRIQDAMRGGRDAAGIELCPEDRDAAPSHLVSDRARALQAKARNARTAEAPLCSLDRPSCRRWVALRDRAVLSRSVARAGHAGAVP